MKFLPVVTLCVFIALCLFATPQIPDTIILNGREYDLISEPLWDYFLEHRDKDPNHINFETIHNYNANPNTNESAVVKKAPRAFYNSTALRRGYIATFEIRDKQLFFKDVRVLNRNGPESVFKVIFPDDDAPKMDWFTGTLVIPKGTFLYGILDDYAMFFEKYILIDIKKGNVVKKRTVNHLECLAWEWIGYEREWLLLALLFCAMPFVVIRLLRVQKSRVEPRMNTDKHE